MKFLLAPSFWIPALGWPIIFLIIIFTNQFIHIGLGTFVKVVVVMMALFEIIILVISAINKDYKKALRFVVNSIVGTLVGIVFVCLILYSLLAWACASGGGCV
jgi:hypothetical protein